MTKFYRTACLALFLLCAMLLVSCGGKTAETTEPGCTHPEEARTVKTAEPTCTEPGYTATICGICGYTDRTEIPAPGHDYEEKYVAAVGADKQFCTRCGDSCFLLYPNDELRLTGYCTGDAVFDVTSDWGDQTVELFIDGASAAKVTCEAGKPAELRAKAIAEGQHSFRFVTTGNHNVTLKETLMDGQFNRPGSILLEMPAVARDKYASFKIFVQTADPSGDYYVCYNMILDNNDDRDSYKADSQTNAYNFRIRTAQLVMVTKVTDTAVAATKLFEVLDKGEISLAFKQDKVDKSTLTPGALEMMGSSQNAVDFSGGFHGDERFELAELYADGEKVALNGRAKSEVIACSTVCFNETATIYAWGTSTADSYGIPELLHSQNFVFDSNGVRNHQTVVWLDDGYQIGNFFLQMFTMYRVSDGKTVCESFDTYDENGKLLGSTTIPMAVGKQMPYLRDAETRLVKYYSATSGVSAEAGFRVIDNTVKPNDIYIAARVGGDNKLYCSFESTKNGRKPVKGETWEVEVHYTIDYVKPE